MARKLVPLLLILACGTDKETPSDDSAAPTVEPPLSEDQLAGLSMTRLKADVDYLASDELGGRTPQSVGHALAREHIVSALSAAGLERAGTDGGYTISFDMSIDDKRYGLDELGEVVEIETTTGVNIAAMLPGADPARAHETLIVMAHYDHLGVTAAGDAYNGAFDDATGVAALLEIARMFQEQDVAPARSILFLITDGEESGLNGAWSWVEEPTFAMDDVVMAFSVDPLGRGLLPDYDPLILLGLERCPELQAEIAALADFADNDVAFVNRDPIFAFASDQDPFYEAETGVPAFWFVSPGMTWYHTVDDTAETIDYRTVQRHASFLAQILAYFGDDDARYQDQGAKALDVSDALYAAALLEGTLGSSELTDAERERATELRDEFLAVVDAGEVNDSLDSTYIGAAIFLLLDLTAAHPGEVPPPFPE